MIVTRSAWIDRINEIANHPDVLPWVRGPLPGPLDVTPIIADERNVALLGQHGAMIFHHLAPRLYEIHTLVEPEGRGRWTIRMAHDALEWMFTRTDADELVTRCPQGNLGAKALVRFMKLEREFTSSTGWFQDDRPIPADVYVMTLPRWVLTAPCLAPQGEGDPIHRRYANAAIAIAAGGQWDKAVRFYNRWAALAQRPLLTPSDLQV